MGRWLNIRHPQFSWASPCISCSIYCSSREILEICFFRPHLHEIIIRKRRRRRGKKRGGWVCLLILMHLSSVSTIMFWNQRISWLGAKLLSPPPDPVLQPQEAHSALYCCDAFNFSFFIEDF